jgi:ketosteroid isomerase-like protein
MTNELCVEVSPLRSFIDQYFEAWRGGVAEDVLDYFSEDAVIHLSSSAGILEGRKMVAEKWVIPTVTNYPGNVHQIENFLEAGDKVMVEWLFTAAHISTGKEIRVPGRSEYWVSGGLIRRGNVYFNRSDARV